MRASAAPDSRRIYRCLTAAACLIGSFASSAPAQEAAPRAPSRPASPPGGQSFSLPRDDGQIWRVYDISDYTASVSVENAQQAVIDWVLRETGTEAWFGEPLGVLSATSTQLRVYHTPEIHQLVAGVVERLNQSRGRRQFLNLRLCTIDSPSWRTQAMRMLQPVAAQSPGVEAWVMSKDDAATLMAQLAKRADYREHSAPNMQVENGQPQTIAKTRPRTYVRGIQPRAGLLGPEPIRAVIEEGFTLQVSPLISLDDQRVDAVIRCHIDQVEKLVTVPVDFVASGGEPRRLQIEVPQLVSWRLHERFRWPSDQVLLLSCGVVAQPQPQRAGLNLPLPLPLPGVAGSTRADALLFIELTSLGRREAAVRAAASPTRGRY